MKTFAFPLEKALGWRRTQLALAESELRQLLAAIAELDRARAELEASSRRTENEVRQLHPLEGGDLSALGRFRLAIKKREQELAAKRVQFQKELAARQTALAEARRRCRLIERLKERRWVEWQAERDRELEALAADSYMTQWARRAASSL
jgi:flagellar export protein FliJ